MEWNGEYAGVGESDFLVNGRICRVNGAASCEGEFLERRYFSFYRFSKT